VGSSRAAPLDLAGEFDHLSRVLHERSAYAEGATRLISSFIENESNNQKIIEIPVLSRLAQRDLRAMKLSITGSQPLDLVERACLGGVVFGGHVMVRTS
jgi:hypothetical protein